MQSIEKKNECGGLLAYVSKEEGDAQDFLLKHSHVLQKLPYHQCGVALRNEETKEVHIKKFTSLAEDQWVDKLENFDHD